MSTDLAFAEFLDDRTRRYQDDPRYKAALDEEHPYTGIQRQKMCPPDHKHGDTTTCYMHHGCRCVTCRSNAAAVMKRSRMKRARAEWEKRHAA